MTVHDGMSDVNEDAFCDGGSSPPIALSVNPSGIPHELREPDQWVLWQWWYDAQAAKWKKPPCAGVRTFASAYNYYSRIHEHDGIGFQLIPGDGFTVIDLDHCLHDGTLDTDAARIVDTLDSYTEVSPSGCGVHIWIRASIPASVKNLPCHIEMSSGEDGRQRYITCTGGVYHDAPIRACQQAATALYERYWPDTPVPVIGPPQGTVASTGHLYTDDALLDIARSQRHMSRRARFIQLFDEGRWEGSYPSQSEADSALAYDLAWFTGPDAERVERLFGMSGLGQRDKWQGRRDYREKTCTRAIDRMKFYNVAKVENR